jgi:hypothetical protein
MRLTRGCGHRKIGGIYLMGDGAAITCGKIPVEIPSKCGCCGAGVKQTRSFSWINLKFLSLDTNLCGEEHCKTCPIGGRFLAEKVGLLWVGGKFYDTPEKFSIEANAFGISKRISTIPREFKIGETWVMLAHPKAIKKVVHPEDCTCKKPFLVEHEEERPGIFRMFKPTRIEMPVNKHKVKEEDLKALLKRGITPVLCEVDKSGYAIEEIADPN